jgi:thioredoxin 1
MISPLLEKSAQTNSDISFLKVNVDEAQELAAEYKVSALPTIAAFKNGNLKETFMGVRDAKFIETFIKENLN